jgi:uncharacterized protein (DUF2336 family)
MAAQPERPSTSPRKHAVELMSLARDRSAPGRMAFVFDLYDLCADGAELADKERALAVDILVDVVHRAPVSVRQPLAERLASDPRAPHPVVVTLARDEISVAFPVLTESPVLVDDDLIDILRDRPLEHQLGTLQRETLSERVSSAFVEGRNTRLMRWLLENPGAVIPPSAMTVIAQAAQAEPELQRPLVNRPDLPRDLAAMVCAWLPDELRDQLVSKFDLDATPSAKREPSRPAAAAANRRAARHGAGDIGIADLVNALRTAELGAVEGIFARFCGISQASARRILSHPDGPGLAFSLKASKVDKSTFATIYMLLQKERHPSRIVPPTALARATAAFHGLPFDVAIERLAALRDADPEDTIH